MSSSLSRLLLSISAALLLFGGVVHAFAFKKAVAAVTDSNLAAFYAKALKGLWLIDSATLIILACLFGLLGHGRGSCRRAHGPDSCRHGSIALLLHRCVY